MVDIAPSAIAFSAPVAAPDEHRSPRVRFVHPVVVTALHDGRTQRVESRDLSTQGMFLQTREGWGRGTRVSIAFEAGGHCWPFAEGEVVWHRGYSNAALARPAGVGIRFTRYLHPRAKELVRYVCDAVSKEWRLGSPARRPVRSTVVAATLAAVGAPLLAGAVWFWCGRVEEPSRALPPSTPVARVAHAPEPPAEVAEGALPLPPMPGDDVVRAPAEPAQGASSLPTLARAESVRAPAEPTPADPGDDELAPLAAAADPLTFVPAPSMLPTDERRVALASGAATAVTWQGAHDEFRVSPELADGAKVSKVYLLAEPPRLVFDIDGVEPSATQSLPSGERLFARIRVGRQRAATRLVVDLAREPRSFVDEEGAAILSF